MFLVKPRKPTNINWVCIQVELSQGGALSLYSICVECQFVQNCFYATGARIIMACRDMERAQAAVKDVIQSSGNENIVCKKLDLADSKSIREFAEAINEGLTSWPQRTNSKKLLWNRSVSLLIVLLFCRRAQTQHPHQQRRRNGLSLRQNCRRLWDADRCQSPW